MAVERDNDKLSGIFNNMLNSSKMKNLKDLGRSLMGDEEARQRLSKQESDRYEREGY